MLLADLHVYQLSRRICIYKSCPLVLEIGWRVNHTGCLPSALVSGVLPEGKAPPFLSRCQGVNPYSLGRKRCPCCSESGKSAWL